MKKSIFFVLFIAILTSNTAFSGAKYYGKPKQYNIQLYETASAEKPFLVVGKIRVKSSTLEQLAYTMKRVASKNGGDAVLLYKVQNSASISYWTGAQISYAEGVVVRFDDKGIKTITDKTIIPVIQ